MRNLLALFLGTILSLSPAAVFAQRRSGPPRSGAQTKSGKLEVDVVYDVTEEYTSTQPSGAEKSRNEHSLNKLHLEYQQSQLVKAIRHDGTTSVIEPNNGKASGSFSYTHSSEGHGVSGDNLHSDATEHASYQGQLSVNKDGGDGISVDMPDTGDQFNSVSVSIEIPGFGSYQKKSSADSWVYNPSTGRNDLKHGTPESDTDSNVGDTFIPLGLTSANADSSRPPETGCAAHLTTAFNAVAKNGAPEASTSGDLEQVTNFGSFAEGKYKLSVTATRYPADFQLNRDREKREYTETLKFTATLTLGGAAAANSSGSDRVSTALATDLTRRWRYSARAHRVLARAAEV